MWKFSDKQLDVEIKMAGKARQKFQQIDAEGAQAIATESRVGINDLTSCRNISYVLF